MRGILKAMRAEKGFTLIELLVVIGILAAIAGVTVLAVTQFIGRGACEACETEIHQCQTAAAAFWVEHTAHTNDAIYGTLPDSCGDMLNITLLTEMQYGTAWGIDANGVVSGDCETECSP